MIETKKHECDNNKISQELATVGIGLPFILAVIAYTTMFGSDPFDLALLGSTLNVPLSALLASTPEPETTAGLLFGAGAVWVGIGTVLILSRNEIETDADHE